MKFVVGIAFMVAITFATGTVSKNNSVAVGDAKARGDKIGLPSSIAKKSTTNTKLPANGENKPIVMKTLSQKLLESQHDLRDYVSNQINQVYEILKELSKYSIDSPKILKMDVDQVPSIADTLYAGEFNYTYKLSEMRYTNVRVYGMSDFKNYVLWVDQYRGKAEATLMANELKIAGNYSLSNFLKHDRGSFTVKILGNVTYTEKDLFDKFENEIDIVAGEATLTYCKSKYDYGKMNPASALLEDIMSTKLIQETLHRVGKALAHRIRHVIISKIASLKEVSLSSSGADGCNRIASIVRSCVSQIRTWLKKARTIRVPLPGVYHKMKIHRNTIAISNITMTGLNTMHLRSQIEAYREGNEFYIGIEGLAGPLIIGGKVMMTELRNGTLEQIPSAVNYHVAGVDAKIVVSTSLSDDQDSLQVAELDVSISQPNLKIQPRKIDFKSDDLEQLAEFLKPDVESELNKWLKDFVNDTFRRKK